VRLFRLGTFCVLLAAVVVAGCGSTKKAAKAHAGCSKSQLALVKKGQLTVGTDNPAYPPWFGGTPPKGSSWKVSDPTSGQGFESAVVYAVAKKLGFSKGQVHWIVVPFDHTYKPGAKNFDIAVEQISYSAQRAKAVDFSNSYYDVNQALIGLKGQPITRVKSIAQLRSHKLGVQLGTTSYTYAAKKVKPTNRPAVYGNSNDVNSGLKAHQIEGIITDLPTAYYITGSGQVPNSVVVGQFPTEKTPEHFGMVLSKGSALTSCVNTALASVKSSGELAGIKREWLSTKTSVPVLQ
jgi:polar amino acid transport system substrate-binding protein